MTDKSDEYDEETLVERTDTGVSITTEIKRGTGTRDQDKHVVKAKGHTAIEAIEKHIEGVEYVENEVLERTRAFQPGGEADGK